MECLNVTYGKLVYKNLALLTIMARMIEKQSETIVCKNLLAENLKVRKISKLFISKEKPNYIVVLFPALGAEVHTGTMIFHPEYLLIFIPNVFKD